MWPDKVVSFQEDQTFYYCNKYCKYLENNDSNNIYKNNNYYADCCGYCKTCFGQQPRETPLENMLKSFYKE